LIVSNSTNCNSVIETGEGDLTLNQVIEELLRLASMDGLLSFRLLAGGQPLDLLFQGSGAELIRMGAVADLDPDRFYFIGTNAGAKITLEAMIEVLMNGYQDDYGERTALIYVYGGRSYHIEGPATSADILAAAGEAPVADEEAVYLVGAVKVD
jgi:hypothetical protein